LILLLVKSNRPTLIYKWQVFKLCFFFGIDNTHIGEQIKRKCGNKVTKLESLQTKLCHYLTQILCLVSRSLT